MSDYPVIPPKSLIPLRIIQAQLAENAEYLASPECPYDDEIKAFLGVFGGPVAGRMADKSGFLGQNGDKWAALEVETANLFDELKNFGKTIKENDVADRMAYFRAATSLLEKIVGINERAMGLKQISEFQREVMEVIDGVLTPNQRDGVMERLRSKLDLAPTTEGDVE